MSSNYPAELIADCCSETSPLRPESPPLRQVKGVVRDFTHVCAIIDGRWRRNSQQTFSNALPRDARCRGVEVGIAQQAELSAALSAAKQAQAEWASRSLQDRRSVLQRAAVVLRRDADAIAALVADEVGKSIEESRAEVAGAAEFLDTFAAWAMWGRHGELRRGPKAGSEQHVTKHPRGVAAIITPWNFPASNVCQKAGAALITGNTVIWRPSPVAPATALAVTGAFLEAGMPAGVFNTLIEDGPALSQALVAADDVDAVSFTGSTAVGLAIAGVVSARGGAVQCEMGGKNAAVVLADADLDEAAKKIALGAFGFAGQKCTAVSRVFVHTQVRDAFVERLRHATESLLVGDPQVEGHPIGPVISQGQAERLLRAVSSATERGARLVHGGLRMGGDLAHGSYFSPAIVEVGDLADPLLQEELFGPVLALATVTDLRQAIEQVNASTYGLASALFTSDLSAARLFVEKAHTGVVKINEVPPGLSPYAPVCGWGKSSLGVGELGEEGIDFFTHKKTAYFAGDLR